MRYIIPLFVLFSFSSCFRNFYDTRSINQVTEKEAAILKDSSYLVVVHLKDTTLIAKNIFLQDSAMNADLEPAPDSLNAPFTPNFTAGPHKFKIRHKQEVISQVHVFATRTAFTGDPHLSLPWKDMLELQTYKYDLGRSAVSHVLGIAGIAATILTAGLVAFGLSGGFFVGPILTGGF
jgi:hypothetical protein